VLAGLHGVGVATNLPKYGNAVSITQSVGNDSEYNGPLFGFSTAYLIAVITPAAT